MTKRRALMRCSPASTVSRLMNWAGALITLTPRPVKRSTESLGAMAAMTPCTWSCTAPVARWRVGTARCRTGPRCAWHVPARRRGDQRLGGHAAVVEAIAAHLVLLDQHHGDAELGRGRGHREAARAAADDAQIRLAARAAIAWGQGAGALAGGSVPPSRLGGHRGPCVGPPAHLAFAWHAFHFLSAMGISAATSQKHQRQHDFLGDERVCVDRQPARPRRVGVARHAGCIVRLRCGNHAVETGARSR